MTTDTKLAEVMAQLRAALDAGPTPGLWQQPYKLTGRFGIYSGDGKPIAKVEREADAKLIASANPEAIRTILDALDAAQAAQRDATALAMDAEAKAVRYIWLRDNPDPQWRPFALRDDCNGREADARVDAALSKTQPSSNAIRPDDPSPGSGVKGEQP